MNDAKSNQMQFRRAVHGICYKITAGIINKKKHKNISRIKRWQARRMKVRQVHTDRFIFPFPVPSLPQPVITLRRVAV
jgi:hypothetical protein